MRIVTWNINSVRLRSAQIIKFIEESSPDIICLQETKTPDELFPAEIFKQSGFEHIHISGMKGYNGVAILSRIPFKNPQVHNRVGKNDSRHISVDLPNASLHNIYIPAGGDEPDRSINDKFAHKLDFVDEMTKFFSSRYTKDTPLIVVGDFNIAPLENDVWSHKQLLDVVSHTAVEIEKIAAMKDSLDWIDSSRHFVNKEEKCYTWWSYRNRDWNKSNRGRRLDHIWVTTPLKDKLKYHEIFSHVRDWEKPSDHVPLLIEMED